MSAYIAAERERPWLTTAEASELLGAAGLPISTRTLERLRAEGDGPPYLLMARQIRYHRQRLATWVSEHEQGVPAPATRAARRG